MGGASPPNLVYGISMRVVGGKSWRCGWLSLLSVSLVMLASVATPAVAQLPSHQQAVIDSLQYLNYQEGPRTVGELDLIVFEQKSGRAVIVAEAKLTDNFKWARRRARTQLYRFQSYLYAGRITDFVQAFNRDRTVTTNQFQDVGRYVLIGPRGALAAGFDYEVDLTRSEADALQAKLLGQPVPTEP